MPSLLLHGAMRQSTYGQSSYDYINRAAGGEGCLSFEFQFETGGAMCGGPRCPPLQCFRGVLGNTETRKHGALPELGNTETRKHGALPGLGNTETRKNL